MKPRVVWRARAERELISRFVWLAKHADLGTARRFLEAAHQAVDKLAEIPTMGVQRQLPDPRLHGVRMWALDFDGTLVFYQQIEDGIRVLRVIHPSRDFWRVTKRKR